MSNRGLGNRKTGEFFHFGSFSNIRRRKTHGKGGRHWRPTQRYRKTSIWTSHKGRETKNAGTKDAFSWRNTTFVRKKRYLARNRGTYRSRRYG